MPAPLGLQALEFPASASQLGRLQHRCRFDDATPPPPRPALHPYVGPLPAGLGLGATPTGWTWPGLAPPAGGGSSSSRSWGWKGDLHLVTISLSRPLPQPRWGDSHQPHHTTPMNMPYHTHHHAIPQHATLHHTTPHPLPTTPHHTHHHAKPHHTMQHHHTLLHTPLKLGHTQPLMTEESGDNMKKKKRFIYLSLAQVGCGPHLKLSEGRSLQRDIARGSPPQPPPSPPTRRLARLVK